MAESTKESIAGLEKEAEALGLDEEERELLESYNRGEWKHVPLSPEERARIEQGAANAARKDQRVTVRISKTDLSKIRGRALWEGLPHQALADSIMYKYAAKRLVGKADLRQLADSIGFKVKSAAGSRKTPELWLVNADAPLELDDQEKEYLECYEHGEWTSVPLTAEDREIFQRQIRDTFSRDQRITVRLTKKDLRTLKGWALAKGVTHQALMADVLHEFAAGRLADRTRLRELADIIGLTGKGAGSSENLV